MWRTTITDFVLFALSWNQQKMWTRIYLMESSEREKKLIYVIVSCIEAVTVVNLNFQLNTWNSLIYIEKWSKYRAMHTLFPLPTCREREKCVSERERKKPERQNTNEFPKRNGNDSLISAFMFHVYFKYVVNERRRKERTRTHTFTHTHELSHTFGRSLWIAIKLEWYGNKTRELWWWNCFWYKFVGRCMLQLSCWSLPRETKSDRANERKESIYFHSEHISLTFWQWLLLIHNQISLVLLAYNGICRKFISITHTHARERKNART